MTQRAILHLDMDAFFASVEQREHPEYRGRPVIVGADPKNGLGRGVVAACSYEARKFGVHSALPIGRAFRLCPHAVFVRPNGAQYAHVSSGIMEILRRYSDRVEPVSIDEAFVDLTGSQRLLGTPLEAAREIKAVVSREQQLTCSIGIASSKFLAKIASDMRKPDGLFEVAAGAEREFLRELPVGRIWGVGPKTEERLRFLGIGTIGEVAAQSRAFWEERLGKHGGRLWELSHGIDERPVQFRSECQSLSQERTFGADTDDLAAITETLLALSEGVARRARKHGIAAKTVSLKLRFSDFSTFDRQKTFSRQTDDARAVYATAVELLRPFLPLPQKVRLLGIGLSHFDLPGELQPGLFDPGLEKRRRLNAGIDAVVEKFGPQSIRTARLLGRTDEDDQGFSSFLKK